MLKCDTIVPVPRSAATAGPSGNPQPGLDVLNASSLSKSIAGMSGWDLLPYVVHDSLEVLVVDRYVIHINSWNVEAADSQQASTVTNL